MAGIDKILPGKLPRPVVVCSVVFRPIAFMAMAALIAGLMAGVMPGLMPGLIPGAWAQANAQVPVQSRPQAGCEASVERAASDGLQGELGSSRPWRVVAASGHAWAAGVAAGNSVLYRRRGVRIDAALGGVWALLEECAHPERPLHAVMVRMEIIGGPAGIAAARNSSAGVMAFSPLLDAPLVRAGETVRLWQNSSVVRMELLARAEQAGRAGDQIWLRSDAGGFVQRMRGIVRAAGSVEMLP